MSELEHFTQQINEIIDHNNILPFLRYRFLHYVVSHKFHMCDYIIRIGHKYRFKWHISTNNVDIFTRVYWVRKDIIALKYLLYIDDNYPTYVSMFKSLFKSNMKAYYICLESALHKGKYQMCFDENIKRSLNHHTITQIYNQRATFKSLICKSSRNIYFLFV